MPRSFIHPVLAALIAMLTLVAVPAAAAEPSATFSKRAEELIGLFNGSADHASMFTPSFLEQVPPRKLDAISKQAASQLGKARSVARIDAKTPTAGTVRIAFERGTAQLEMVLTAEPPHQIQGLLIVGTEIKDDSFAAIVRDMAALPGTTALSVTMLGDGAPVPIVTDDGNRPMAIGSAFKLFLLAELSRSIQAGEREWDDVVPLTHHSLPSGWLAAWPKGSPLTLHTLAGLMISQSDNTATDTLLHLLGREKVEALLPTLGVRAAERNRPLLSTLEAFAIKAGDEALRSAWVKGNEAERRRLIESRLAEIGPADIDASRFTGEPLAIDSVEWFASTADLVRTMDWIRRHGDERALALLAINPGVRATMAANFDYLGFKGGSETGVLNMTFLIRDKAEQWYAASGTWNNESTPLDESRFASLMTRAVALLGNGMAR